MAEEILVINGHDYSRFVESKGVGWQRNDLDSSKTTRTKNGTMRRDKITTKRTLGFKLINMSREQLAQLDDDLSDSTFSVTYLDLHGPQTRVFYCSSFRAELDSVIAGVSTWSDATFNIIEV